MAKLEFSGKVTHRLRSFFTLNRIAIGVFARHLTGRKIADDWSASTEIGIRFWRHQFTVAMTHKDIKIGRAMYESLQTLTDDFYDVTIEYHDKPRGYWYVPKDMKNNMTLLYYHGGGYTFGGPTSKRFAAMIAHHTGARVFMPTYRLTPEHPHPAQAEDALTAWQYLRQTTAAEKLIVIGDSAGGHMALSLLQALRDHNETQPALCIALCPWTDIGARGASMETNNHYDMVQGWMALRFGEWLNPQDHYDREALSPINWNFAGLAPIYMQAGGREMLRDMIVEFAQKQSQNGASILFDLWDDMPHDFQIYDSLQKSSTQALQRIHAAVETVGVSSASLAPLPEITKVTSGVFLDR